MPLGFSFRETMRGAYYWTDAPVDEHPLEFTLHVSTSSIRRFFRDRTWNLQGTVTADALATQSPLTGTLLFRLPDEHRLAYRFSFVADDGRKLEFRGQKDWTPLAPIASMTVLPASLYSEQGLELARATVHFALRNDLVGFLGSFRLAY